MKNYSENFEVNLLNWFNVNKRNLSFRNTKDPYKIWVSEIMAQQTQISTMLPYYNRFMQEFPTYSDLAIAKEEKVLELWEGLGYYSRAKNLKKAAEIINNLEYFPDDFNSLMSLPGIGAYTAGAILSIAFNKRFPAIDGNVLRVFSRLYGIKESIDKTSTKKEIERLIKNHLENQLSPGDFNQAVMELGALICLKKSPKCLLCPVNAFCRAYKEGNPSSYPIKSKKIKKEIDNYEVLIPILNNKPLFIKRDDKDVLKNLYGFPMIKSSKIPGEPIKKLANYFGINHLDFLGTSKHIFTHKIWNSNVYTGLAKKNLENLEENPPMIPTAFKKMISLIRN